MNSEVINQKLRQAVGDSANNILEIYRYSSCFGPTNKKTLKSPNLTQICVDTLDELDFSLFDTKYDVIVLNNIIEHSNHSEIVLQRLKDYCNQDARLIVSAMNSSHISNIEKFLSGDISTCPTKMHSPASLYKHLMNCGWMPNLRDYIATSHQNGEFSELLITANEKLAIPRGATEKYIYIENMILECKTFVVPDSKMEEASFCVVVPVSRDIQYESNIPCSSGLNEVKARIVVCKEATSAGDALESSIAKCDKEWILFCHQDVYFPSGFGYMLNNILSGIEKHTQDKILIGFAGLGLNGDNIAVKSGFVIDRMHTFDFPSTNKAISIDEFAMVIHRDSIHRIDKNAGWHMWGTDLCLASITQHGVYPLIVRAPIFHNSHNDFILPDSFNDSVEYLFKKYPNIPQINSLCGIFNRKDK